MKTIKQMYREARQTIRQNGWYGLRWVEQPMRENMERLQIVEFSKDSLAERADIIAYCAREGIECNVRHTTGERP